MGDKGPVRLDPAHLGVRAALIQAARCLPGATPRLDAELLAAHLLGVTRETLLLRHLDDVLDASGWHDLVARRMRHEPVAYITGIREFWSLPFHVTPAVLVPRPDSESLIVAAQEHFAQKGTAPRRILDLGVGSGCLLLAALSLWPEARGVGIDRSPDALAVAMGNARELGFVTRADFLVDDWTRWSDPAALPDFARTPFDLILANPPYIVQDAPLARDIVDHEPASALYAGVDGLDAYRDIAPFLPVGLAPDGLACVEIGAGQERAVTALIQNVGLCTATRQDLAGHVRCVLASREAICATGGKEK